ncbi:hypothetical protein Tco_1304779 [Tanacetum coccineum]
MERMKVALPYWKDKDWSKVVITDEIFEYVIDKCGRNLKENNEMVNIILKYLRQKAYNEPEVAKKVTVISSRDEDLFSDEEIVLMGDNLFSMKIKHKLLQLQDAVNGVDVDVGYSRTRRKSRFISCVVHLDCGFEISNLWSRDYLFEKLKLLIVGLYVFEEFRDYLTCIAIDLVV